MALNSKITKSALLDKLRANRDEHIDLHSKALTAYREYLERALEHELERARAGKTVDHGFLYKYPIPESHTDDFDRVIEMLENDVRDEIELTEGEFRMYFQNEWSWMKQFTVSNATYGVVA